MDNEMRINDLSFGMNGMEEWIYILEQIARLQGALGRVPFVNSCGHSLLACNASRVARTQGVIGGR